MTFEEFCREVGLMVANEDRPCVTASVAATRRISEIIYNCDLVDVVALFGPQAVKRTDYMMGMEFDNTLLAGFIALLVPTPEDFPSPDEPLCLPAAAGKWFIMAIRDPHKALDGRNIIIHGDPNGEG